LASHQGEQGDRLGLVAIQLLPVDPGQHRPSVDDQRAHQLLAGLGVVPRTGRLAWVVVMGAKDQHGSGRVTPTHPADGPNQLGHRVLSGDRVVQQRGVQRPPVPSNQDPVWAITIRTASKIRSGRSETRSLLRHKVSTVG
jgi:hypothetical protein